MNILSNIFILIVFAHLAGCASYSRRTEIFAEPLSSPIGKRVSISYIQEEGRNLTQQAADSSELAEFLNKKFKNLNYFSELSLEVEYLDKSEDRLIEVIESKQQSRNNIGFMEVLNPLPLTTETTYRFKVYDQKGFRKSYSSSLKTTTCSFFLLFPIGIYQRATDRPDIDKETLVAEIFLQIKADIEAGVF